jgi:TPR repeat protein
MRTFKAAVAALVLAASFVGSVAAGPFEDAAAAYEKRDYATALRLMSPLAEQGIADAQNHLGVMYAKGQGVPQDYAAAMSWYCKAAEQGIADAQNHLGVMYEMGRGVRQDYATAVSWYRKAAEQGDANADRSPASSVSRSIWAGAIRHLKRITSLSAAARPEEPAGAHLPQLRMVKAVDPGRRSKTSPRAPEMPGAAAKRH